MSVTHLPILQVVLPLMAAPLCVMIRNAKVVWGLTAAVSWATFGIAARLFHHVFHQGALSYELGNWAAPWGIEYRVDAMNALVLLIVAGIGAIVLLFARSSVEQEIPQARVHFFYSAYLLCLTGLLGMAITGDVFNLFVFLEISSLSSYILIGMGSDRRALTAAFQYLIVGTIGATFIVIGVGLLYMMTGTLNMADLAVRIPPVAHSRTVLSACAFLTVGIGVKAAMFPLHMWLPNAYTYAPSTVTAFLAGTATKVAVYALFRFFFTVFGAVPIFKEVPVDEILIGTALAGILIASTIAISQPNVKRLLAYSSVAQIGYMLLGMSLVSVTGFTAALVHLFNHAIIKSGLFLSLGCIMYRLGSVLLDDLQGLGKSMPWTMGAFVVGGLGLIGIPLTAGFITKWYLILAAIQQGRWLIAAAVLVGSLLAGIYMWRIVEVAYFQPRPQGSHPVAEAPLSLLIPTWLLAGFSIYFGLDTRLPVGMARRAAELLLGGGA